MSPSQNVTEEVTITCTECDDFEFTKTYEGVPGTRGEREFEKLGGFEACPVCDGELTFHTEQEEQ